MKKNAYYCLNVITSIFYHTHNIPNCDVVILFSFDKYLWFLKLLHFRKENKRPAHDTLIDDQQKVQTKF